MARFEIPDGWVAQAYRFALDPSAAQVAMLESHDAAVGRIRAQLDYKATTTGGEKGTGTGSSPAASVTAGDGRGAIQKTSLPTATAAVGTAGGDETSIPHTTSMGAGTAAPQGEAA